jgi:putative DNA primase/helicase
MPPDVISAASREYQSEQDRVKQFCDEMCEMGAGLEVPLTDTFGGLYQAYQSWCKDGGMYALSKVKLCQELERLVPFYDKIERKSGGDEGRRKKLTIIKGLTTLG